MVYSILNALETHPKGMLLILQLIGVPELRDLLSEEYSTWLLKTIDMVRPLFAEMGDEHPEDSAILFFAALDGLMGLALLGPRMFDKDRMLTAIEDRFLKTGHDRNE